MSMPRFQEHVAYLRWRERKREEAAEERPKAGKQKR